MAPPSTGIAPTRLLSMRLPSMRLLSMRLLSMRRLPLRRLPLRRLPLRPLSMRSMAMPRRPIPLLPVCLLLTLAACATPQQRAARNQADVERMMVEYGPACERLGYQPNSDGWRGCVLRLNARDDLQRYPMSPGYYDGGGPGWYGGGGWWRPIW